MQAEQRLGKFENLGSISFNNSVLVKQLWEDCYDACVFSSAIVPCVACESYEILKRYARVGLIIFLWNKRPVAYSFVDTEFCITAQ
jgi:hypothetical protein